MATIASNRTYWDRRYNWQEAGDEWSRPWGGVLPQWFGTLLPRIHGFVPTGTILEIGCGYGRWTQLLKELCDRLLVVDLSERCIAECRARFAGVEHIEYHVNDGCSLRSIANDTVDFAFSFDSLVHADIEAMDAYLAECGRVLTPTGAMFVHHSNLGEYRRERDAGELEDFLHLRDPSVSAALVAQRARAHGLSCISQEVVHWRGSSVMIDCLSTIVRADAPLDRENRVLRNTRFMDEARNAFQLAQLYEHAVSLGPERHHRVDGGGAIRRHEAGGQADREE